MDTTIIQRNGETIPIGELYVSQLEDGAIDYLLKDWIKRGIQYEWLLLLKRDHMPAHYDKNAKFREVFTDKQVEEAQTNAKHFPTEIQRRFSSAYEQIANTMEISHAS